jgi:hypothetical protein
MPTAGKAAGRRHRPWISSPTGISTSNYASEIAASPLRSAAALGGNMTERRTVAQCRWAESTLFLAHPYWTDANDYPWSCVADGDPAVVEDTGRCADCGRWAPRAPHLVTGCACQTSVVKLP